MERWKRGSQTDKGSGESPHSPVARTQHRGNMMRSEGHWLFKCNCVSCYSFLTSQECVSTQSPPQYEVLINWAGPRQNGLTSWIIALGLSSPPCSEATSHIHLVLSVSQISGAHFIRLELIVNQLTRTWLKGPITMAGKSEHMHYGLLLWLSIYGCSKHWVGNFLSWQNNFNGGEK